MSITDFILWLMSGLGASMAFSYFAERQKWFQELPSDLKKFWATVGASGVAMLAYVLYVYVPVMVWEMLSPYWQIVVAVVTVNYGTQVFHRYDKSTLK